MQVYNHMHHVRSLCAYAEVAGLRLVYIIAWPKFKIVEFK